MAKVVISHFLMEQVRKVFKGDSIKIFRLMKTLEDNPHKGKNISHVTGISIKELKYHKYKFYCITDGHVLKFGTEDELANLLIKFVRMSEKKDQKKVINEIKNALKEFGLSKVES